MPKLRTKYRLSLSHALLLSTFTLKGRTNEGGKMKNASTLEEKHVFTISLCD